MYREVEGHPRMTTNEAAERYPDSYIIMRMDSMKLSTHMMGAVLYVADNESELYPVLRGMDDSSLCVVSEGLHLQSSLGGVVVGG
jgi:hypothetical protein